MSHPYYHARSSARKFGGVPEDYIELHSWFDQTKQSWGDIRHRAILHNSVGIFLLEENWSLRERIRELEQQLLLQSDDDDPRHLHPLALGEVPLPTTLTRHSDGHKVPIRLVGEQHVQEDIGFIPTLSQWLEDLPRKAWHGLRAQRLSREEESDHVG